MSVDQFDLFELQTSTERSRNYVEDSIRHANEAQQDVHREKRLELRLCTWCFYFRRGMLAGQAFTKWKCGGCGKEDMHPNTATPRLCNGCSDKYNACIKCGADIDLKKRNKLERKK